MATFDPQATKSNPLWTLLQKIQRGKKPSRNRTTVSGRCRFEQLEPRMLLSAQAYDWNSVTIKANGFIDGIVYSPAAPNLAYIHTDMGGAYRWDQSANRWMPLTDWIQGPDWSVNYNGAETMAVDPTDANRVYLGLGTYMGTSAVLRSTDQGRTWERTNVGFEMNGNGSARNAGERMNVDPNSPNILYYGARDDGLWKSTDYGATWNRVNAFPTIGQDGGVEADTGIVWTLFDKSSGAPGNATPVIYAGVVHYDAGVDRIYRSTDGGATWAAIPGGQPTTLNYFPQRAALTPDGNTLYLTYGYSTDYPGPWGISEGTVYKVTNPDAAAPIWTEISPPVNYGFSGVAIDPTNPNAVYVTELGNYNPADRIWRSTNGGSSWTAITPNSFRDDSSAPYASSLGVHWLGDLQIDPFNHNVAMFTTGYGLYRTTNLTAAQPSWEFFNDGFEQSAVLELSSPNT
ncbi:MAG TPA: LEPR-XLL domain-containing protein, partial [Candidatus Entotheonella sp.]